mmetsp:Transcript_11452/g.28959  ORF Transcript_11452/g.28959 Transcript_11452/m.28959 type:complete len:170 (-) Transcript_11452:504-1013(-)
MSSLQQALNNAANKFNLKKLGDTDKPKGGSGAFENSFAAGLDISEFISTDGGSSSGNRTSAAEELLKIKEEERRQRQIHEEEEQKMEEALQKRLDSLKNRPKEKVRKPSGFELGDALARMHGSDERAASVLSRKNVGGASKSRRSSGSRRTSLKSNKSLVAKKSRKSKF